MPLSKKTPPKPKQWDFSTELRLSRPANGAAPEDVLGVTTAGPSGTCYSLVADDPSTADGLFAFVRGGAAAAGASSSSPSAITRRATLLVGAMPSRLLSDVKSENEQRKKEKREKKEKKEKKKEKRKEK